MRIKIFKSKWATTYTLTSCAVMWVACISVVLNSAQVMAQAVYRSVDANGRVTFSDKPPATVAANVAPVVKATSGNPLGIDVLPSDLRQVVAKFPVILYTSANCPPCEGGRRYLVTRGVPFSEKTVNTAQDVDALATISGARALPFLTIGGQHVSGYSSTDWSQYLNAAGYPERSKLPANYTAPPAMALAPVSAASSPEHPSDAAEPVKLPPAPNRDINRSPTGIQF